MKIQPTRYYILFLNIWSNWIVHPIHLKHYILNLQNLHHTNILFLVGTPHCWVKEAHPLYRYWKAWKILIRYLWILDLKESPPLPIFADRLYVLWIYQSTFFRILRKYSPFGWGFCPNPHQYSGPYLLRTASWRHDTYLEVLHSCRCGGSTVGLFGPVSRPGRRRRTRWRRGWVRWSKGGNSASRKYGRWRWRWRRRWVLCGCLISYQAREGISLDHERWEYSTSVSSPASHTKIIFASTMQRAKVEAPNRPPITICISPFWVALTAVMRSVAPLEKASNVVPARACPIFKILVSFSITFER